MTRPPTLVTERLLLRELRLSDAQAVATGAGDRRVARHLLQVPSPYPIAVARRWVAGRIAWWDVGRGATLAIVRRTTPDALLGTVSLRRYPRDLRAELGYWLCADEWGKGIVSEATHAVVEWGFTVLALRRIYAQVLDDNLASCRVLEKLGMVHEGIKRQHVLKARKLHNVLLYGILRDEWSG